MKLYGASGHAKVITDIIRSVGDDVDLLYDDNDRIKSLCSIPVVLPSRVEGPLIISIGNNRIRKMIAERYASVGFGRAVSPFAVVSESAEIREGTVVMPRVVIEADSRIGKHCIVNTSASINHECVLEDFVHISPNATLCGNVHVGEGSWVGAGATVIQGVKIGRWCTVGAGAVVLHDLPDGAVAFGNPCKIHRIDKAVD